MTHLPPPRKITSNIQPPKSIKDLSRTKPVSIPETIPEIIYSSDIYSPLKNDEDEIKKTRGRKIVLLSAAIIASFMIIGSLNSKPDVNEPVIEVAPVTELEETATITEPQPEIISEPDPVVEEVAPIEPAPEPAPIPVPAEPVQPAPPVNGECDPNYTSCVPIDPDDVDCAGGSGNGPSYFNGTATVIGIDIYDLDRDGDGIACN